MSALSCTGAPPGCWPPNGSTWRPSDCTCCTLSRPASRRRSRPCATAAERANRRGAPESAAVFLRRALLEPPDSRALTADLHSELGLCLSAQVRPGAADLLADAVELAATPEQRVRIALSGSRALGMAGHFDRAIELCRLGLSQPVDAGARATWVARAGDGVRHAPRRGHRRGGARPGTPARGSDDDVLWRVIAAWALLNESCPASEVNRAAAARPRSGHPAAQRRVTGEHDREVPADRQR